MELYSWAEVVKEFDHLYGVAKKDRFEPVNGSSLFDHITQEMLIRGDGKHLGYKFPDDLKYFRSVLSKLKRQQKEGFVRKKKFVQPELKFRSFKKGAKKRPRVTSEDTREGYVYPNESLEDQVERLGLNPDTYF